MVNLHEIHEIPGFYDEVDEVLGDDEGQVSVDLAVEVSAAEDRLVVGKY